MQEARKRSDRAYFFEKEKLDDGFYRPIHQLKAWVHGKGWFWSLLFRSLNDRERPGARKPHLKNGKKEGRYRGCAKTTVERN